MADHAQRRSWLQFSLRMLLWIMLCVAIGIAAYRRGFDAGYADRANQRSEVGNPMVHVYAIGDILPKETVNGTVRPDYDGLIDDLTAHVLPNTWVESGGQAIVKEYAASASLVVSHDQDGHGRIAEYFERLRRKNKNAMLSSQ